jgi:hypothetical protein
MALYVQLQYEDGLLTPVVRVDVEPGDEPVEVVIASIDNGVVSAIKVTDDDGLLVAQTPVEMFLRIVDTLQVTVVPPKNGWPPAACFSKQVDEAAVLAMRDKLQGMAERLHCRQQALTAEDYP